jgi:hypothetical protein
VNTLWLLAASVSPSPSSSTVPEIDPDRVSPGFLGLLAVLFMGVAVFVIWKSLNKQIKRVDFDESTTENPRYTRKKAEREAAAAAAVDLGAGPEEPTPSPPSSPAP